MVVGAVSQFVTSVPVTSPTAKHILGSLECPRLVRARFPEEAIEGFVGPLFRYTIWHSAEDQ